MPGCREGGSSSSSRGSWRQRGPGCGAARGPLARSRGRPDRWREGPGPPWAQDGAFRCTRSGAGVPGGGSALSLWRSLGCGQKGQGTGGGQAERPSPCPSPLPHLLPAARATVGGAGTPRAGVELCPSCLFSSPHWGLLLSPWHDSHSRPRPVPHPPQPLRTGAGPFPASTAGAGWGRASAPSHPWPPRPAGPGPHPSVLCPCPSSLQPSRINCAPRAACLPPPRPPETLPPHPVYNPLPPWATRPPWAAPPPAMEAARGPESWEPLGCRPPGPSPSPAALQPQTLKSPRT